MKKTLAALIAGAMLVSTAPANASMWSSWSNFKSAVSRAIANSKDTKVLHANSHIKIALKVKPQYKIFWENAKRVKAAQERVDKETKDRLNRKDQERFNNALSQRDRARSINGR